MNAWDSGVHKFSQYSTSMAAISSLLCILSLIPLPYSPPIPPSLLLVCFFPKILYIFCECECVWSRESKSKWNGGFKGKSCVCEGDVYMLNAHCPHLYSNSEWARVRESINFPTLMLLPNRHYYYYCCCCCYTFFCPPYTYISFHHRSLVFICSRWKIFHFVCLCEWTECIE